MTRYDIRINKQDRQSLAMKITPEGLLVLLPHKADPESKQVQAFIKAGLARLPELELPMPPLDRTELQELVEAWAGRLEVTVNRIQLREMHRKWASFSSKGTLTLARDLQTLPVDLVEYAICHELLHSRLPNHGKGFQAMLATWIPDWRERRQRLMVQALSVSQGGR